VGVPVESAPAVAAKKKAAQKKAAKKKAAEGEEVPGHADHANPDQLLRQAENFGTPRLSP
jgi:hypothetical protein